MKENAVINEQAGTDSLSDDITTTTTNAKDRRDRYQARQKKKQGHAVEISEDQEWKNAVRGQCSSDFEFTLEEQQHQAAKAKKKKGKGRRSNGGVKSKRLPKTRKSGSKGKSGGTNGDSKNEIGQVAADRDKTNQRGGLASGGLAIGQAYHQLSEWERECVNGGFDDKTQMEKYGFIVYRQGYVRIVGSLKKNEKNPDFLQGSWDTRTKSILRQQTGVRCHHTTQNRHQKIIGKSSTRRCKQCQ